MSPKPSAAVQGASLRPTDFTRGGLVDDVTAEIVGSRFELFDYGGKSTAGPQPALKLSIKDEEGNEYEQYYSAGDSKFFVPSDDGTKLVPVGTRTSLAEGSNFAFFMGHLFDAGGDAVAELVGDDISVLEGMVAHFTRVPQPERKGLPAQPGQQDRGPKTTLVIDNIVSMPGEAKKATGGKAAPKPAAKAPAGKAAAKAPAAAASNNGGGDLDETLQSIVMEVLSETSPLPKAKLAGAVFKAGRAAGHTPKELAEMSKRAVSDDFLTADGQPWTYDGGELSI